MEFSDFFIKNLDIMACFSRETFPKAKRTALLVSP